MGASFPTTGILEDGSGADEDPLDTHWDGTHTFLAGDSGELAKISNQLTDATGGGTDTSLCYDGVSGVQQFSGNVESWVTIVVASTTTGDELKLPIMNARNDPAADGYELNIIKAAGADTWQLRRRDNVAATVLGADLGTQEVGNGDSIGFSFIAGVLTAYYKPSGGSWVQFGTTRSDSTYTGPWWLGLKTVQAVPRSWKLVPFGGGSIVPSGLVPSFVDFLGFL